MSSPRIAVVLVSALGISMAAAGATQAIAWSVPRPITPTYAGGVGVVRDAGDDASAPEVTVNVGHIIKAGSTFKVFTFGEAGTAADLSSTEFDLAPSSTSTYEAAARNDAAEDSTTTR